MALAGAAVVGFFGVVSVVGRGMGRASKTKRMMRRAEKKAETLMDAVMQVVS